MDLTSILNGDISKTALLNIHQQKLENESDYNNDDKTQEIVDIFGGIDTVLKLLLSSDDVKLDNDQLTQIYNKTIKQSTNNYKLVTRKNEKEIHEAEDPEEWTYCFEKTNTFLHSLFGQKYATKIFNIINSKCSLILLIIFVFMMILLYIPFTQFLPNIYALNICMALHVMLYSYSFAMLFCILLAVNKRCFQLIISSFEFWLKLLYTIQFVITCAIYRAYSTSYIVGFSLINILCIVVFSSFDALQM
eukprot:UN08945